MWAAATSLARAANLTGAVLVEVIFGYSGIGAVVCKAIRSSDF
jgi:ABC-type dipeptide/oligopeptide/nickel transport system permease component